MGDQYPRKPRHLERHPDEITPVPLRPLSEFEEDEVARRREDFLTLLPDALPFFRDLYKEGLISGWRSISYSCSIVNIPDTLASAPPFDDA